MERQVKVRGREVTAAEYDEIIEENELITVEWWAVEYVNGVNYLRYEAMCPEDYDDWDHREMAEYIKGAVHAMYDIEADMEDA